MKKIGVELAILVRMSKNVVVEVPDDFDREDDEWEGFLSDVYEADDGEGYEEENSWSCKKGTHTIHTTVDPTQEPDFRMVDGVILKVEKSKNDRGAGWYDGYEQRKR